MSGSFVFVFLFAQTLCEGSQSMVGFGCSDLLANFLSPLGAELVDFLASLIQATQLFLSSFMHLFATKSTLDDLSNCEAQKRIITHQFHPHNHIESFRVLCQHYSSMNLFTWRDLLGDGSARPNRQAVDFKQQSIVFPDPKFP